MSHRAWTAEEDSTFIRWWNAFRPLDEMALGFATSRSVVSARAQWLRQKGRALNLRRGAVGRPRKLRLSGASEVYPDPAMREPAVLLIPTMPGHVVQPAIIYGPDGQATGEIMDPVSRAKRRPEAASAGAFQPVEDSRLSTRATQSVPTAEVR